VESETTCRVFLGPRGRAELQALGPNAITIQKSADLDGQDRQRLRTSQKRGRSPSAFAFRGFHRGQFGGYMKRL
jgi:hypothetical protein